MLGCVSCDALGSYYQPAQGSTACVICATHTQRYVGVLSAANKTACQCKEGAAHARTRLLPQARGRCLCATTLHSLQARLCACCRLLQPNRNGWRGAFRTGQNGVFVFLRSEPGALNCFLQACEKCTPQSLRRRPPVARAADGGRHPFMEHAGSACAGPIGSYCEGRLEPPRRQSMQHAAFVAFDYGDV